jgi:hypothetical protein
MNSKYKYILIILLYLHFAANLTHAAAHTYFGVALAPLHALFALIFFFTMPALSLYYLHKGKNEQGVILSLMFSIPTSIYAYLYHFVLNTHDFVCLFGAVALGEWFVYSAYAISIILLLILLMSVISAYVISSQNSLIATINNIERNGKLPKGTEERFNGFGIMGITFDSGHILALRRFPQSSVGDAYTSVWHRTPYGYWTFYADIKPEHSCSRFFGRDINRTVISPISIEVSDSNKMCIQIKEHRLNWEFNIESNLKTKLMNAISLFIPEFMWRSKVFLSILGKVASLTFKLGNINLYGIAPNGQSFIANPYRLWEVKNTKATINSISLGSVKELKPQAMLGDFKIPQQPLFVLGKAYFTKGDIILPTNNIAEYDC